MFEWPGFQMTAVVRPAFRVEPPVLRLRCLQNEKGGRVGPD